MLGTIVSRLDALLYRSLFVGVFLFAALGLGAVFESNKAQMPAILAGAGAALVAMAGVSYTGAAAMLSDRVRQTATWPWEREPWDRARATSLTIAAGMLFRAGIAFALSASLAFARLNLSDWFGPPEWMRHGDVVIGFLSRIGGGIAVGTGAVGLWWALRALSHSENR